MKKIWFLILLFVVACGQVSNNLRQDKVYFFYSDGCPHCHSALEYIDKKYSAVSISMINVSMPDGYKAFLNAAKAYKLSGRIGTPFIIFGDKYILGWGADSEEKFDEYIRPFLNK